MKQTYSSSKTSLSFTFQSVRNFFLFLSQRLVAVPWLIFSSDRASLKTIFPTRFPNWSVAAVSNLSFMSFETVKNIKVLTGPPMDCYRKCVSLVSRYGIWCRLCSSAKKTFPRPASDLFICFVSSNAFLLTFDRSIISDPARSTRWSFDIFVPCNTSIWTIQCDLELYAVIEVSFVDRLRFAFLIACSTSLTHVMFTFARPGTWTLLGEVGRSRIYSFSSFVRFSCFCDLRCCPVGPPSRSYILSLHISSADICTWTVCEFPSVMLKRCWRARRFTPGSSGDPSIMYVFPDPACP